MIDQCLAHIFSHFDRLEDLLVLSEVSIRWNKVVRTRLSKVKYLLKGFNHGTGPEILILNESNTLKGINMGQVFPNLKILDVTLNDPGSLVPIGFNDLRKIVNDNPQIKGLISNIDGWDENGRLEHIEMASIVGLQENFMDIYHPEKVSQLMITCYWLETIEECSNYFKNLKRLNIALRLEEYDFRDEIFPNLKILELYNASYQPVQYVFQFLDFIPSLESIFLFIVKKNSSQEPNEFIVEEAILLPRLKDLVIEWPADPKQQVTQEWSVLKTFLKKFPNLKHLALRNHSNITNDHVAEMVQVLTNLEVLDLRGSPQITKEASEHVEAHCKKMQSSISFYYNCEEEPPEWPKLNRDTYAINDGFNFMRNCFYKSFEHLPLLLDPKE